MLLKNVIGCACVLAGSLLLAISSTSAATLTWDTAPGTVGPGNGTVTGGAGTWNTSNGNWTVDGGANNIAWVNGNNDTAVFGGTAGTVTLGANVTVGGLTFNTTGYTIAPGSGPFGITFGTTSTVNVNSTSTGSSSISAAISGGNMVKSGTGTLILSGNNSFGSGTFAFGAASTNSGAIRLASANALGNYTAINLFGGSTVYNRIELTGGLTFNAYNITTGGRTSPAGSGAALANISGSNTWQGSIAINAGGGSYGIRSDADLLTLNGEIRNDLTSARAWEFSGAGNILVNGTVKEGLSALALSVLKTGGGSLTLAGANTYSGTTTVNVGILRFNSVAAGTNAQALGAGTVVNLGVAGTSSGEIEYYGASSGTLDKNVFALGTGRNRIRNSGGGTLTLSGTLTKNGTILELASGTFSVSGQITGSSANSDLYVNGATVTLSNTNNDYVGPTYVYGNGTLALGASNVIPGNSIVTLGGTGSDTGTGTINTGLFTDTVAALTTSSLGATVGISGSGATIGGLSTTGDLTFGGGTDTLALSLTSPTLGRYTIMTYAGTRSGTFDSVTGNGNYNLVYGAASNGTIDLQLKANQDTTFSLTPAASRVLVGGSTQLSGVLANTSPTDSAALSWSPASTGTLTASGFTSSVGSTIAAGSTSTITAWVAAGNTVGSQAWSIANTDNNAITTVSTATGSISVVNQRSFSLSSGTINAGTFLRTLGASGSTSVTSLGAFATTASGTLGSFSPTNTNGLTLATSDPAAFNGAATQTANYLLGSSATSAGAINGSFTSNVSAELGSISPLTVSLVGTALDPAVASFASGATTTSLLLDFGQVNQDASVSPLNFSLFNLMQTNGFTADLALYEILLGTGNSGAITTTLSTFNTLAAGLNNGYTASFTTTTTGLFQNVYTLRFKSSNGGSIYSSDTPQSLTLTVQGVIIVPEPRTLAMLAVGAAIMGLRLARRRSRGASPRQYPE